VQVAVIVLTIFASALSELLVSLLADAGLSADASLSSIAAIEDSLHDAVAQCAVVLASADAVKSMFLRTLDIMQVSAR
jgi:hypothetical protein